MTRQARAASCAVWTSRHERHGTTSPSREVVINTLRDTTLRDTTDPLAPVSGPRGPIERWLAERLRDPRDLVFVRTAVELSAKMGVVAALYYAQLLPAWTAVLWLPWMMVRYQGRYTLMLHATSHRPLFTREHPWLEAWIPWVMGPFFGHTPGSFYVHHIGMHHPENNLDADLSSTLGYQRDRFSHFLHYWARFLFPGTLHLLRYLRDRGRSKLLRRFVRSELAWLALVVVALAVDPVAGAIVFVGPFLLIRFFMMTGNWSQHAFVDVDDPGNAYRNSTCLINARYNHLCYNDGYHIVHHLKPSLHYTEMARWFYDHVEDFGREDAVVFDGLGNNQTVWWCLMTQDWDKLASHMVDLPGAPVRTHAEKVAMLQDRVRRTGAARRGLLERPPPPERALAAK